MWKNAMEGRMGENVEEPMNTSKGNENYMQGFCEKHAEVLCIACRAFQNRWPG